MTNPQLEKGYLRIANSLFDALYIKAHLTQRQLTVISFIIRQTYGYSRKSHDMSYLFIANGTGIARRHVITVIKQLEEYKIITVDRTQNRNIIGINKHFDEWQTGDQIGTSDQFSTSDQIGHQTSDQSSHQTSDQIGHPNKDRRKKTDEIKTDSYAHFDSLWALYPRKKGKGAVTKQALKDIERNADDVRKAIAAYVAEIERQHTEERYIMYGSTFFNGRWRDYLGAMPDAEERTESRWKGEMIE